MVVDVMAHRLMSSAASRLRDAAWTIDITASRLARSVEGLAEDGDGRAMDDYAELLAVLGRVQARTEEAEELMSMADMRLDRLVATLEDKQDERGDG
ncbi:hypothetical protein HLV35_07410 [Eggerthellaceae bacterium zg-997]|nr:hypothetical protein [Eggerthellaceae bacterium zg-997]